jgi:hypothetical protein
MNASFLRSRVTRVAPVSLLLGLLLLGGPVTPVTAGNCTMTPCISFVTVYPHGMFAGFTFQTSLPGLAGVEVSTKPPGPGPAFNPADVVAVNFAGTTTEHEAVLQNLVPGTTYHYVVSAFDSKGNEARTQGTFTTLIRKVAVTFKNIHVAHTTMDGLSFAFERFGWLLNPKDPQHPEDAQQLFTVNGEWSDGDDINPNVTNTVVGHKEDAMTLGVEAWASEEDDIPIALILGIPVPQRWPGTVQTGGCKDCIDNTATTQVAFGGRGVQEEFTEDFSFATPSGSNPDLQFSVVANVQVRYVPTING